MEDDVSMAMTTSSGASGLVHVAAYGADQKTVAAFDWVGAVVIVPDATIVSPPG
jgi:hypothetical protein